MKKFVKNREQAFGIILVLVNNPRIIGRLCLQNKFIYHLTLVNETLAINRKSSPSPTSFSALLFCFSSRMSSVYQGAEGRFVIVRVFRGAFL